MGWLGKTSKPKSGLLVFPSHPILPYSGFALYILPVSKFLAGLPSFSPPLSCVDVFARRLFAITVFLPILSFYRCSFCPFLSWGYVSLRSVFLMSPKFYRLSITSFPDALVLQCLGRPFPQSTYFPLRPVLPFTACPYIG